MARPKAAPTPPPSKTVQPPADPDNFNRIRANRANTAVNAHMKARGCHAETDLGNMSNLLCDLHHMADKLGILWQCVLNVAEAHYVKETAPPKTKQPTKKSKA